MKIKEQSKENMIASFKLELEANMQNLPLFLKEAIKFAKQIGLQKSSIMHIELVLEEIIVNIISYAYDKKQNGKIILEGCVIEDKILKLIVKDFGVPFNLINAKDPDIELSIEERDTGGLGIFLVKHLMNDIKYERQDNKNILTLIKHIESGDKYGNNI